ncbi:GDSL-type esterase/lipase family protein [Micromonospora echinospora]|uniref:GDSL-type esterase/lipase family protein n=1 Tax=Micromonospora echinospora TaxID=1877 RepID=UPI003671666E
MAAVLATLAPGVASPASAATPKIMVVGDSISQGAEGDFTWRYRLARHFGESATGVDFVGPWTGTRVLNADHSDSSVSHAGAYRPGISFDSANLAQWGWQMHQAKDVIGSRVSTYLPDYLLVALGFNDLGWGVNEPAGVLNDFEWFVYHARAAKPTIRIAVANVPQRTPLAVNPTLPARISAYNTLLANRIPQISTDVSPITLVDIDTPFDEYRDAYDGLHPNVRGEFVIAKAFGDTLSTHFGLGASFGPVPTDLPADLALAASANITATPVDDKVRVTWSHVFGATGYEFWQRDLTRGTAWQKGQFDVGADSWTPDFLPAGHQLEFRVRATRGTSQVGGNSPSATATVRPMPDVPNVRVTEHPDRPYTVTVSWDPVPGADDYHVYAAPGCDLIPPAPSEFTKHQWSLGGKTSWTQEYVTDPCRNYLVVASRYGGEGARKFEQIRRAWPYQNNPAYFSTRQRYMESAPEPGDRRVSTTVPPSSVDRGIVVVRGFIKDNDPFTHMIGDRRSFASGSHASAKVGVAWDTKTGDVGVYVHRSCVVGSDIPDDWEAGCKDALPVQIVPDASIYGDDNTSPYNYVSVAPRLDGSMVVKVAAINSHATGLGRINAQVVLTPAQSQFNATLTGDKFPAWEIYQFPWSAQAVTPSGAGWTIGTRDQTSIGDLTSGASSTCHSQQPFPQHWLQNTMSC